MSEKNLLEMLNHVEDCYIEEANPRNMKKHPLFKRGWWIAAAACVCLILLVGYRMSLSTREPYNATNINTEDAIVAVPYGDTMVYVFQKKIETSHEYTFEAEFEYKGVPYHLFINTNDEAYILEMIETIVGESDNHIFTDVFHFDSYYVKAEESFPGFVNWKYFTQIDGVEICLAEAFGYTTAKPQIYQKDLDGDGVEEMICNSMYGTGAERVYVFRYHDGVIEVGYLCYDLTDENMFPGITNMGSSHIQEIYHPENETFEIMYPTEEGMGSTILQDMEWVEFVPYEIGYF